MNKLRFATSEDAELLLDIYSPYVKDTSVSFELTVPSIDEFAKRIREISEFYPYIVYESDGIIAGYAYAHRFAERAAYCYSVEVSIYVRSTFHSTGIAQKLYGALFAILEQQGLYNAYSAITVPNPQSRRFHEKFGFELTGTFHNVGFKLGEWHAVEWFSKGIKQPDPIPQPLTPIGELEPQLLSSILLKFA